MVEKGELKVSKERLLFIENLRILLIILVILVHLAITYGAPVGDWYYRGRDHEIQAGMVESIFYLFFLGVTQSFFMGFFFLISSNFTPGSYDRKGAWHFLRDRLIRLGIPLLFYIILIDPVIEYALDSSIYGFAGSFWDFLPLYIRNYSGLGSGPLWFVETLLIFNVVYVLWRLLVKRQTNIQNKIPSNKTIVTFALILGIATFIVRLWYPLGWNFELLNLQFPFFPQYIAMFIVGLIAYRGTWFLQISKETGMLWFRVATGLIMFFPFLIVLYSNTGNPERFAGGFYWQALIYALWEQFIGIAIIIALSVLFREKFNNQGRLAKTMSENVYSVYVFHAPIIVFLALVLRDVVLNPLIKFVIVAPLAVFLCFLLGNYIRKLPFAGRIL